MTKENLFKEPLFPEINFQNHGEKMFVMSTALRIKNPDDGKYYRTLVLRAVKSNTEITVEEREFKTQLLIRDAYFTLIFGKVDLLLRTANEDFVFYLDDDQREESERLKDPDYYKKA